MVHTIIPIKVEVVLNHIQSLEKVLGEVEEIKKRHPDIVVTIRVQQANLPL